MKRSVFLQLAALFTFVVPSLANGYGDYPPDLVWSPSDDILIASLEDSLVLWQEGFGTITVITGETSSPAISPDGAMAAFVMEGRIFVLDLQGHRYSPELLVHVDSAEACTFDPLSSSREPIICFTKHFLGSQLFATSTVHPGVVRLLPDKGSARVSAPVFSPDGRNIACTNFAMNPSWYEELYLIGDSAPFGRRARASISFRDRSEWHESNPVWINDSLLVFQIGGWDEWELRSLNINDGRDSLVLDNAHQAAVALNGRYMAFCRNNPLFQLEWSTGWEEPTEVWVMDTETGYLRQASEQKEWARQPAISNDGRYIAWIRVEREGESLIVNDSEAFINFRN